MIATVSITAPKSGLGAHNHAAIYPDAITGAAGLLNRSRPAIGDQT